MKASNDGAEVNVPFGRDGEYVMVCDNCKRASCWQAANACDKYHSAGTMKLTIQELKELNLESPSYWKEEQMQAWRKK